MKLKPIAHVREADGFIQWLPDHLIGVSLLAGEFARKIGLADQGELMGLLHDLGKYSEEFQNYLKSAVELLNPDEDEEFVDAKGLKGKVDHSTAGAQLIWQEFSRLELELTPFHGHLIVLTEGVRDAQSQTAVPGAIS